MPTWWADTGQVAIGRRAALERIRKPRVSEKAHFGSDQPLRERLRERGRALLSWLGLRNGR